MKEKSKKEIIFGIIFFTWFILSILGIMATSMLHMTYLSLFIFGQYFAVFGCVSMYNEVGIAILHYTVGIIVMSVTPIAKNYDRLSILATDLSSNQKLFIGLAILMLILGYISLILFLIKKKNKYYVTFLVLHILYLIEVLYLSIS